MIEVRCEQMSSLRIPLLETLCTSIDTMNDNYRSLIKTQICSVNGRVPVCSSGCTAHARSDAVFICDGFRLNSISWDKSSIPRHWTWTVHKQVLYVSDTFKVAEIVACTYNNNSSWQ